MSETTELFTPAAPEFVERSLRTSELPDSFATPPPKLLRSVEDYGVVQPIVVREVAGALQELGYVVVDGKRRLAAARRLGIKRIRARIFTSNGWTPDALTVTLNAARGANVAAELDAIERMAKAGMDEATISKRTGMALGTLRQRMKLLSLAPVLRDALRDARIAPSAAERAVRLSVAAQEALAATAGPEGRITAKMVAAANTVRQEQAIAGLELPPAVPTDWREEVRAALVFALQHAEDERVRNSIELTLEEHSLMLAYIPEEEVS